jgi:acetyl/propionyl-CoA carboxylase alpha subunit
VAEQLWIAAGASLSPSVVDAAARAGNPSRHAIEVRLSAEDPARDFAPSPGRVGRWVMPAGPGVRVDTAVVAGERIAPDYDPMIAKVMTVATDRAGAIATMRRALDEIQITGIQTTLPFHRALVRDLSFADAELSIEWVADHWDGPAARAAALDIARHAAAVATPAAGPTGAAGDGPPVEAPGASRPDAPSLRKDGADPTESWRAAGRWAATDRWPR